MRAVKTVAFAGNPNVGKSTVFNALTGLRQHTGNWAGKTVEIMEGVCVHGDKRFRCIDVPGAYSLLARSREEELARDCLCFSGADVIVIVCDATSLERSFNLVLQCLETAQRAVVCVNLLDEAEKKGLKIDLPLLEARLGVPVAGTSARAGKGLAGLMARVCDALAPRDAPKPPVVTYDAPIEEAVSALLPALTPQLSGRLDPRWTALRLLEGDARLLAELDAHLPAPLLQNAAFSELLLDTRARLRAAGYPQARVSDCLTAGVYRRAEALLSGVVQKSADRTAARQQAVDRFLTGKVTGVPVMLLLLCLIFFITIEGANLPSALLMRLLNAPEDWLVQALLSLGAPAWLADLLIRGCYHVLSWVVAVMLPPMAIFFPLFTLLEDLGYLPRIAFNLDRRFRRCGACGKQALTMCMGFGCNAAAVVGCRIIDSPRERLIAILTNSFVPCNGRFPALITLLTLFCAGGTALGRMGAAALLTVLIAFSVGMTMLGSKLLSRTLLSGVPSAFTLELPPFRRPQVGRVIVRSLIDRTALVLGRAVCVAAPAGLVIWLFANVDAAGVSLLARCAAFLDPFAELFGLDGVLLCAFLLGLPANEIVLPIALMGYAATGTLQQMGDFASVSALLLANGWTMRTAVCTMLFMLLHWPCATTIRTIRKETGSLRWTLLSILLPLLFGLTLCFLVAQAWNLFL